MTATFNTPKPGRSVFIADSKGGALWRPLEFTRIVSGQFTKGTLLKIWDAVVSPTTKTPSKTIPFSCICFSGGMSPTISDEQLRRAQSEKLQLDADQIPSSKGNESCFSSIFIATDQRGHIYAFDMQANRFWLVARAGISATCITFSSSKRRREIIVGLSDHALHCYSIDSCQLVAKLPAYHRSEPHTLTSHPFLPIAISTSATEAIIWDTEAWDRKRILLGSPSTLQQATFTHDGEHILTAFSEGTLLMWHTATFQARWKISLERFLQLDTLSGVSHTSVARMNYFTSSRDSTILVYGGLHSTILVWSMTEKALKHEIAIPQLKDKCIIQLSFIGDSKKLALLTNDGEVLFIDVLEARFIGQLQGKHLFKVFAISPDGKLMVTILMGEKHIISVIRLDPILKQRYEDALSGEFALEGVETAVESAFSAVPTFSVDPSDTTKVVQLLHQFPKTFYELVETKSETSLLNRKRLRHFLRYFGQYPVSYRVLVWRYLLKLPENREHFDALMDRDLHPSVRGFRKKFPLKSDKLAVSMEKVLSALAYWSPLFENLDYLPPFIFPFVQLFVNDRFCSLEVIMTIILNWCQKWWEYYPNPPIEVIGVIEDMLKHHDPVLLAHFVDLGVTSQLFCWPMMKTAFTEILSKEDWYKTWDHFISNSPGFMYSWIVAYIKSHRVSLLACKKKKDVEFFFSRQSSAVPIASITKAAYVLNEATPAFAQPMTYLEEFNPILKGQYPIFNAYPEYVVNYQVKMKDRIRQEEYEYLRQKAKSLKAEKLVDNLAQDRRAWELADANLSNVVELWWDELMRKPGVPSIESKTDEVKAEMLKNVTQARQKYLNTHLSATRSKLAEFENVQGPSDILMHHYLREDLNSILSTKGEGGEWEARKGELFRSRSPARSPEKSVHFEMDGSTRPL